MSEYLIQSENLTSIADKIRILSGTETSMGLSDMVTHIDEANTNVNTETDLIAQITIALEGKAGGKTDPVLQDKTVIPTANTQTITADSGYDGLGSVTINGIPDTFSELNFEVIGGTTEPTNPKENTIWVNTDVEITGWYFSATQPENMAEGEVWFTTGDSSEVAFNALKKNTIQVSPSIVKQWVSGELKDVTAKSYQDGKWVDLVSLEGVFYKKGNECTEITGGWTSKKNCLGNITKKADRISLNLTGKSGGDTYFVSYTKNKIDLSDYKKISFVFDSFNRSDTEDSSVRVYVGLFKNISTVTDEESLMNECVATKQVTTKGTAYVDVSGLRNSYYVAVCGLFWNESSFTLDADIVEVFAE